MVVFMLGAGGVERKLERDAPTTVFIGLDHPVRHHDDRLVDQLEAAFRLADRFDGECPEIGGARRFQAHVDSQPFVAQAQAQGAAQVELRAELPEDVAIRIREISAVSVRRHAGKIHLDGEMQWPADRQIF